MKRPVAFLISTRRGSPTTSIYGDLMDITRAFNRQWSMDFDREQCINEFTGQVFSFAEHRDAQLQLNTRNGWGR